MPQKNSASDKRNAIHRFLSAYADGKYSDSGVERDFETGHFIIVLPRSASTATDRALRMLESRILKDIGLTAKATHFAGKSNEAVSTVLLQSLSTILREGLEELILAESGRSCDVVILLESAACIPEKEVDRLVKRRITTVLKPLELSIGRVSYAVLRDDAPSEHQIIRALSTHAPTSAKGLQSQLGDMGYTVPSSRWLNRKLDFLTRNGFVVYQQSVGFALTESGLGLLPRQEHRYSPDVQRALALARRKWLH